MARNVPLSRHQRPVGGEVEDIRETWGFCSSIAERWWWRTHCLASVDEQDECSVQVLRGLHTEGTVQESLGWNKDGEAGGGSGCFGWNHQLQGKILKCFSGMFESLYSSCWTFRVETERMESKWANVIHHFIVSFESIWLVLRRMCSKWEKSGNSCWKISVDGDIVLNIMWC